jgi:hypothetical protein
MVTCHKSWIDHHVAVDVVERLDDAHSRKAPLDLLTDAVRVADRQRRRPGLGEIESVGDVDEDLPGQRLLACLVEGGERHGAGRAVEDGLAEDSDPHRVLPSVSLPRETRARAGCFPARS